MNFYKQFYFHKPFTTHFISCSKKLWSLVSNPTSHTSFHFKYSFLSLNNLHTKLEEYFPTYSPCFLLWIIGFLFLLHSNTLHTSNPHFYPFLCFPSKTHSKYSFKYYTVSCITRVYYFIHPFHLYSYSSIYSHNPYYSASNILYSTSHPSLL